MSCGFARRPDGPRLGWYGLVPRKDPRDILENGYRVSDLAIRIRLIEAIRLLRQGRTQEGRRLASACWYAASRALCAGVSCRWLYVRAGVLAGQPRGALLASLGM